MALLHVTNGDSVVGALRAVGLGGHVLPWRDVLHEGPVPAASWAELRQVRARFLGGLEGAAGAEQVLRELVQRDQQVLQHRGEYVLWFEADLYDQLQLIQIVTMMADGGVSPGRVSLVQIGEFPGIAHFAGIGQLNSAQLASLFPARQPLDQAAYHSAATAWQAFTRSDPLTLPAIAAGQSPTLRFVAEAFVRLMQEYPWRGDGLALTERRILAAIQAGITRPGLVFKRIAGQEMRPYLGDSSFFRLLAGVRDARTPLAVQAGGQLALTESGRDVLLGPADHVRLNGPDRWLGGVHLHPDGDDWRYDERLETITRGP